MAKPPVQHEETPDSKPTLPDLTLPDIQAKFSYLLQPRVPEQQPDLNNLTPRDCTPVSSPLQPTSPSLHTDPPTRGSLAPLKPPVPHPHLHPSSQRPRRSHSARNDDTDPRKGRGNGHIQGRLKQGQTPIIQVRLHLTLRRTILKHIFCRRRQKNSHPDPFPDALSLSGHHHPPLLPLPTTFNKY